MALVLRKTQTLTTDEQSSGAERRAWPRFRPTTARPCRVTVRGLGDGVSVGQVPRDLSLGGCKLSWVRVPPRRGTRCVAEVQVPGAVLLLEGVVAHVGAESATSGPIGLRFLPGVALESALMPLSSYLHTLQQLQSNTSGSSCGTMGEGVLR